MKIKLSYAMLIACAMLVPASIMADKVYSGDDEDTFDYIIVGFGSAGAILARKLSDDKKTTVLVLEAGSNLMEDPNTLNPNTLATAEELTFNPLYAAAYPVPVSNFSAIVYSEGREWGGSAAHNGLQAVRGVPSDYNQWAVNSGSIQWSYPNVFPILYGIESYTPNGTIADPSQRNIAPGGPIAITQQPPVSSNPLAIAIATVAGAPLESDYNNALLPDVSTSAVQQFITAGAGSRRSFSAFEFMTIGQQMDEKGRGLHGRKCRVKGNATVTRILIHKNHGNWQAQGVEYIRQSQKNPKEKETVKKVYARKKVILCAGAVNSPKLLMLSGVGDPAILEPLDIKVKVANPNVGAHLQNQYGSTAVMTFPSAVNGTIMSFIDAEPYMPADDTRRIQIIASGVAATHTASLTGFIVHPQSQGSVQIVSKDPLTPAQFNQAFYTDGSVSTPGTDAYLIVSFYKIAEAIAASAGGTMIFPTPATFAAGDNALLASAKLINGTSLTYHAVGTTRFGTSIANGVVDANLNVFGVNNLMVADIGVTSPPVSGNTCLSAYVVGEKACQILGLPVPPIL
jgi:choline dehydrogenase